MACLEILHSCMFAEGDECLYEASQFACLWDKIRACLLKETSVFMRLHNLHILRYKIPTLGFLNSN